MYDIGVSLSHAAPESAAILTCLVDFADAYGLLPAWTEKLISLMFGHNWNGFDLIAANPLRFLLVARKLRSVSIYQEAMRHAVGLKYFLIMQDMLFADSDFDEAELDSCLDSHTKAFRDSCAYFEGELIRLEPSGDPKYGLPRDVGLAMWRDFILKQLVGRKRVTILYLLREGAFDISTVTAYWGGNNGPWYESVSVPVSQVHQVIEGCLRTAQQLLRKAFGPEGEARGRKLDHFYKADYPDRSYNVQTGYIANVKFSPDYKYPWPKGAKEEVYVP